jgi:sialidase-1
MGRFHSPTFDALEERALLAVLTGADEPPALVASPLASGGDISSRSLMASSAAAQANAALLPLYTDFVEGDVATNVVGRYIFYNNSQYDGNDPRANSKDAFAIAPDKTALLPGQTAGFANYTGYSRGINGIIVDIAGTSGTPTLEDFQFRVGNSADPSAWLSGPTPSAMVVQSGAGSGGSTRVIFTWLDGAIADSWLQVTVKATARTGLAADDVFYYGNLAGDSTNTPGVAVVTLTDRSAMLNYFASGANAVSITSLYDHNRDTEVNGLDEAIALQVGRRLTLFTAPEAPDVVLPLRQQPVLFAPGDYGFHNFFSPTMVRAVDGSILVFAEARATEDDYSPKVIGLRRSYDGGVTWTPVQRVVDVHHIPSAYVGNLAPIVDEITGEVVLVYSFSNSRVFVTRSADHGITWTTPVEVTSSVKVTVFGNPNPGAFSSRAWGWYATGPGHGIQIKNGPYAGRLIVGSDHRYTVDVSGPSWSHVIYSDDHGITWHLGGGLDPTHAVNQFSNESTVVEASDGSLYMSIRINNGSNRRGYSRSYDGGATWSDMVIEPSITTLPMQGSLLRLNEDTILFSAPNTRDLAREQISVWRSSDDGATWSAAKAISFDYVTYSDMVVVDENTVLFAYSASHTDVKGWHYIKLARFDLDWLLSDAPYEFTWNFNEEAAGAQANIRGTSIFDASPWEIRSAARANSEAEAPTYVAGRHAGDSALALTEGSDAVQLTAPDIHALHFLGEEDFTVQLTLRTTDTDGVLIGSDPALNNWSLKVVDGYLQFATISNAASSTTTSTVPVNDGQWHQVVAIRNAASRRLSLYVDGVLSEVPLPTLPAIDLKSNAAVTLGAYNDGSEPLTFQIDVLRITRAVVPEGDFLTEQYVSPPRFSGPAYPSDAPSTLAGLKLWLPAYDPTRYFTAFGQADPMPLAPVAGDATQSALDASGNGLRVSVKNNFREVLYSDDNEVGASWLHGNNFVESGLGDEWIVENPQNAGVGNFDFVQNTGLFTLSMFVKPASFGSGYMTLFDTGEAGVANSGFTFRLFNDGSLGLVISADSTFRINSYTAGGLVSTDSWYHVVVVGQGVDQPVTYYVTPVTAASVVAYPSSEVIGGADGAYPTDATHALSIGALANTGMAGFHGNMVDQAIYDRPLTPAEVQQLFDYTKKI